MELCNLPILVISTEAIEDKEQAKVAWVTNDNFNPEWRNLYPLRDLTPLLVFSPTTDG